MSTRCIDNVWTIVYNDLITFEGEIKMLNASEIKFGVEIECNLPVTCGVQAGAYHRGTQITDAPNGLEWTAR